MREPRAPLANVQAFLLEPPLDVVCMLRAGRHDALLVDEHADPRRLAVATDEELRPNGPLRTLGEDLHNAIGVLPWTVAEEGNREMEVVGANTPRSGSVELGRPRGELLRRGVRDGKAEEEA